MKWAERLRFAGPLAAAAALGLVGLVGGGGLWALGPGAAGLVDRFGDGIKVWRVGRVQLDGVFGPSLSDLTVARLTIEDEEGVWLEAQNVRVTWSPMALLTRRADVERVDVARAHVLRRPALSPPEPDSGGGGVAYDVDAVRVGDISLAPGALTEAPAQFTFAGSLEGSAEALRALEASLTRIDGGADALEISYRLADAPELDARIVGAPDGPFAALLDLPKGEGLELTARIQGDEARGFAAAEGRIGAEQAVSLRGTWGAGAWSGEGRLNLAPAPALADAAARLGGALTIWGSGRLPAETREPAPFTARAEAPNLALVAQGALTGSYELAGPVRIEARAPHLGPLSGLEAIEGGAASFTGELRTLRQGQRLAGTLALTGVKAAGQTLSARGPISAALLAREAALEAELRFGPAARDADPAAALLSGASVQFDARLPRPEGDLRLRRLRLDGPNIGFSAEGSLAPGGRLSGRWSLPRLAALEPSLRGAASGRFQLTNDGAQRLTVSGRGAGVGGGPGDLGALLGAAPTLEVDASRSEAGVLNVRRAVLNGRQIRAGLAGEVGERTVDLRLEGSARGPAPVGGAVLDGVFDVTGRVYGPRSAPGLRLEAGFDRLDVAGLAFSTAVLGVEVRPGATRTGQARLAAQLNGRPVEASAALDLEDGVSFEDLEARIAGLQLAGSARLGEAGPSADLRIGGRFGGIVPGVRGQTLGTLRVIPTPSGEPALDLDLALSEARYRRRLALSDATLRADGALSDLDWTVALTGQAGGLPLQLDATGEAALTEAGARLAATLEGAYAEQRIATLDPLRFSRVDGALEAGGRLQLGAGAASFTLDAPADRVTGSVELSEAPLALLSFLSEEPLQGAASGYLRLNGRGARLDGEADVSLTGVRFARRARDPVDARLTATLRNDTLEGRLNARSRDGLAVSVEGTAPAVASAAPLRLGLAEGTAQATWAIGGPIDGLWSLVGPLDQRLSGRIEGRGAARFNAEGFSGDGRLELSGAAFEDKITGLKLDKAGALVVFGPDGATLERLEAQGPRGGTVAGSGRIESARRGELTLRLDRVQLVDRSGARARGGGELTLAWGPDATTLKGALRLSEAEIDIEELAVSSVPTIAVVEINKPGERPAVARRALARAEALARGEEPPRRARAQDGEEDEEADEPAFEDLAERPVGLDIAVSAPNRVFTRGRGLDAEWRLDLRVRGTVEEPLVYGEVASLRGTFALAGRTFEIEEESLIRFDGDPTAAEVDLTATSETTDLTVTVNVTGGVDDPQLAFSSDPALPEDEILPQFLFGRATEDLTPLQAAQLAASLAALAGQSSFDLTTAARNLVALDRLDVRQEEEGVSVAGGRYLTRDVYLELSRGPLGVTTTTVEWRVRPRLFLVSSFLSNGDQRLSVRWRRDLGKRFAPIDDPAAGGGP